MAILNKSTFPLVSLMTALLFAFISTPVEAAPPATPSNVSVNADGRLNVILIHWDPPNDNSITKYKIKQIGPYPKSSGTPGAPPDAIAATEVDLPEIPVADILNPAPNTAGAKIGYNINQPTVTESSWYWFKVAAVNADGTSDYSSWARGRVNADPFGPATNFQAVIQEQDSPGLAGSFHGDNDFVVRLTWTAPNPAPNLSGYVIIQTGHADAEYLHIPAAATTYTTGVLTEGTYYFTIIGEATGGGGYGTPSAPVQFNVPGRTSPDAPTGLQTTVDLDAMTVTLTWTVPTFTGGADVLDYSILQRDSEDNDEYYRSLPADATSYTTPTLAGGTYRFRVIARNNIGFSAWSDAIDATLATMPVFHTSADDPTPLTVDAFTVYQGGDQGGVALFPDDADGDEITLSFSTSITGIGTLVIVEIGNLTVLLLKNVPADAPVGDHTVTVEARSGGDTATLTVTAAVKARPRFDTPFSNQVFIIDETVDLTLPEATYDDTGTVTYTLTPALPDGLAFDTTTRKISGTPTATFSETTYTYTAQNPALPNDRTQDASLTFTIAVEEEPENRAPVFTDGDSTTRSVAENTASGTDIGNAIAATDADNDALTYTLGGTDASSFSIVNTSGQLQTSAALDYETKSSYSVTVSVSDGKGGSDSISVTINVTDVTETPANNAPVFTDGTTATRSVAENTTSGTNIGNAIAATDADNDALTYTLGGTDASSFSIVSTSGQLQTSASLDYETKSSYSVTVSVSDGKGGSDSITVTINVTDVTETPANNAPVFTDGDSTTRTIAENTPANTNIGNAIAATDADRDTLTYTLGGTDASSFSIISTSGQLQTRAVLDYETKSSYSVTVSVSDGNGGSDSITVTINVTDVTETPANNAPVFTEGDTTTRTIPENTAAGINIGSAVSAADSDSGDTLTYTLGGTDASSFSIVSTSGQLQTRAALDYETKNAYSVTVSVSDGNGGSDSISVTINVTDVNEDPTNNAPTFTEGDSTTRTIAENTPANTNIGTAVAATDADNDPLTYTLGGTDASSFSIVSTSGQLQTSAALDYETKSSYSVTVSVSDGKGGSDSISVTINITDVDEPSANNPPIFTDGDTTTRSVAENTASGTNIGNAIAATDTDNDTLTYSLAGTDASSFGIVSTSGQLQTSAALDYETKSSYSVTVFVSDGKGGSDSISVTINVTDVNETPPPPPGPTNNVPVFTDGDSTTRSVAENTASGTNIGNAIAATDANNDPLTYTLGGTDASSFGIVSTSGQLQTSAALDYETKSSYSVTVSVSDGNGGSDSISVTINITDVDETVVQPSTPPSGGGTQQPRTLPTPSPVNHTVKPFDYDQRGVGKVVFSEWMLSKLNNMPQWIELYNTTNADINLRGWQIVGRYMDGDDNVHILKSHTIRSLTLKAKEAHVIAAYAATLYGGSYSENLRGKVYSLRDVTSTWNRRAIVLELQDSKGAPIDRIGNLNVQDEITWAIPNKTRHNVNKERRISLIRRLRSIESRQYNFRFGMKAFGWFTADEVEKLTETQRSEYFYGRPTDLGTPGYRTEGADPLPVTLSAFIPQISESGRVVLNWTTESELENAGFNIFRSEGNQGPFVKVNVRLIQGAGTTSERNTYQWTDTTAKPGVEYYYRIEDMSFDGISAVLATQLLKGVFTAKNRLLTNWGQVKRSDIP